MTMLEHCDKAKTILESSSPGLILSEKVKSAEEEEEIRILGVEPLIGLNYPPVLLRSLLLVSRGSSPGSPLLPEGEGGRGKGNGNGRLRRMEPVEGAGGAR